MVKVKTELSRETFCAHISFGLSNKGHCARKSSVTDYPPSTFTSTATTPPTTPPAPALTVESRRSSPTFSAREPLQRPDSALKLLVLRLHPVQHFTNPLHVPVRLVRPSSRVVFSSVILVTLLEDSRVSE
jgi:hypothetical protein